LPPGTTGEAYEETLTFFLPTEILDPGSGLTASLNSVTVTSIAGVPLGLEVQLDDPDGTYYPASGQTSGCATLCGDPQLPGVYEMVITVAAVASVFGIEQVVNESFSYALIINPGSGGTSTFSYSTAAGCDSVWVDFAAGLSGSETQITNYNWSFGNGETGNAAIVDSVFYAEAGSYSVTLQTVISELILEQLILNSTGGGGWDDFFGNPDPYFVLTDANGTNVYTSSTADDSNSNTWNGLNIILNNPPYTISFYDEDLFDGDDNLGSTSFDPIEAGAISLNAGASNAVANIGSNELVNVADTLVVQVFETPEFVLYQSDDNTLSCSDSTLSLYTWYTNGLPLPTGNDFNFSPNSSGWYSAEGISEYGCNTTSDSILFCHPESVLPLELVTQNDLPDYLETASAGTFYVWSQDNIPLDTLYGEENAMFFPSESGYYGVESTDTLGCPLVSENLLVCFPIDTVFLIQDSEGTLVVNQPFASYSWFQNGLNAPDITDSVWVDPGAGIYAVEVSDYLGCPTLLSADWAYVSVPELTLQNPPTVYPNPFRHSLSIEADGTQMQWDATLINLQGELVKFSPKITSPFLWNLEGLRSGIYILQLQQNGPRGGFVLPPVRVIKE
jgi:hypothetical protein